MLWCLCSVGKSKHLNVPNLLISRERGQEGDMPNLSQTFSHLYCIVVHNTCCLTFSDHWQCSFRYKGGWQPNTVPTLVWGFRAPPRGHYIPTYSTVPSGLIYQLCLHSFSGCSSRVFQLRWRKKCENISHRAFYKRNKGRKTTNDQIATFYILDSNVWVTKPFIMKEDKQNKTVFVSV